MSAKEHSAGGVIFENGQALLILMKTFQGGQVWTFPKGHLDPGETAEQAALREVAEETGWDCEIISPLGAAKYSFTRNGELVDKDVTWFLMKRAGGDGIPRTPDEVLDSAWLSLEEAEKRLSYLSDLDLVDTLKKL